VACCHKRGAKGQGVATGYWLLATGYWLLATGYRATGYRLPATGYRLPATGYRAQPPSLHRTRSEKRVASSVARSEANSAFLV